jgi:hypothetical protein
MASVLSMMSFKEALNGWRISSVSRGRKVGSWFNPGIIIENSFVYGRREWNPRGKAEEIYSLPN